MVETIIKIVSFYLFLIGVWRLGNSTISVSHRTATSRLNRDAKKYNPLCDLIAVKSVFVWTWDSLINFNHDGFDKSAAISHKKFAWGMFWILLAIMLQQVVK